LQKGKSARKKGDEGEHFVAEYLKSLGFLTEIHPRTMRMVRNKSGQSFYISIDNDFHNCFDVKGERSDCMIYAQVKVELARGKANMSRAESHIDREYPHQFPYQRIQVWQVWKEWVHSPGETRHKEFRFRVQERKGFHDSKKWQFEGVFFKKGIWVDVSPEELLPVSDFEIYNFKE